MLPMKKLMGVALSSMMFFSATSIFADETKVDKPDMAKTVEGKENGQAIALGETVTFKLTSTVPSDLFDGNKLESPNGEAENLTVIGEYPVTIHDDMSEGFSLVQETIAVKVVHQDGTTDVVEATPVVTGNDFTVTVDLVDLFNKGTITTADLGRAKLVVTYQATLTSDTTPGKHTNDAYATYTDGKNVSGTSKTDTVIKEVYGIKVVKTNKDGSKTLAGAEFALMATDDAGATPIATGTTDADGVITFDGLEPDTYYLFETKAPETYIRSTSSIDVVVNNDADENKDYIIEVPVTNSKAPETGGMGTMAFTVGGAALLGTAVVVLASKKRK